MAEYWRACERRIAPFVDRHYRWPGVLALHRAATGLDLLRAPVNVLLAVPALLVQIAAMLLRSAGAVGASRRLLALPLGLETAVERTVAERVRRELLGFTSRGEAEAWVHLASEAAPPHSEPVRSRAAPGPDALLAALDALIERYAETRRATADVTNVLILGLLGFLLAGRFTPGSISAGQELAAGVARHEAVHDFFLGPTLGGWYYRVFPPEAPLWADVAGIAAVVLSMSLIAAFSGLVADPLQARVGLHQARLRTWLRTLRQLAGGPTTGKRYQPWDPYMARVADVADAVKALLP